MKKRFLISVMLLSVVLMSCNNTQKFNQLTKAKKKAGGELLFNGENFDGWRFFQGGEIDRRWTATDGVMNNSGVGSDQGGDIIITKEFENFDLYLEWKISPQSNSGIFYHVQEGDTKKIYETAPEYQLIDDKGWKRDLNEAQHSGTNYDMDKPSSIEVKPIGEWNITRIIVNGSHVQHFLNGKMVVEYDLWTDEWKEHKVNCKWKDKSLYGMVKKGYIGLQDHGGLTQFRNIKIRKL